MKKTPRSFNSTLKPRSDRVAKRNQVWKSVVLNRMTYLKAKYGRLICEYCGLPGNDDSDSLQGMWGHHMDGNRNNTNQENCYIVHTAGCHTEITEKHIGVEQEDFRRLRGG